MQTSCLKGCSVWGSKDTVLLIALSVCCVCCACAVRVLCLQGGDLIGNLITSAAEVPGLIFSLFMIHYCSRKLAFAVPMSIIPIPLIPLMAGAPKHTYEGRGCLVLLDILLKRSAPDVGGLKSALLLMHAQLGNPTGWMLTPSCWPTVHSRRARPQGRTGPAAVVPDALLDV